MSVRVVGDARVVANFRALPSEFRTAVSQRVGELVLALARYVQVEKLTGQVLRVRTGTLRRSIQQVVVERGPEVLGIVSTNVEYAPRHEYGYSGPEAVKAHLRTIKQAWGKPLAEPRAVAVRAHTRNINYPARSFMRTALADMAPQIVAQIKDAAGEALR